MCIRLLTRRGTSRVCRCIWCRFWWRVPVLQSSRSVALRTEPTPTEDAPAGATPTAAPATKSHCSAFGRAVGRGQTEGFLAVRLVPRFLCLVVNIFRWLTACWYSRLERSGRGIYLGPHASALDELRKLHRPQIYRVIMPSLASIRAFHPGKLGVPSTRLGRGRALAAAMSFPFRDRTESYSRRKQVSMLLRRGRAQTLGMLCGVH